MGLALLGQVLETAELFVEEEIDGPDRAVAMLGDDDLADVFFILPLRLLDIVVVFAVKEEHEVRHLLDLATLSEMTEHRPLRAQGLHGPAQLRDGDDGYVELLGL